MTGVWVGYDRPRSLGKDETGSRVAVPIWTAFMQEALAGTPPEDFPIPERVVLVPVDMNASGGCVRPVTMAFIAGTEPKEACGPARYAPASLPPAAPSRRCCRPPAPRPLPTARALRSLRAPPAPAAPPSTSAQPPQS